MVVSSQAFATEVTILGKITVDSQIVTEDGEVYEIAETEKGGKMRRCSFEMFLFDTAEVCFIVVTGPLFSRNVFQLFMN